MNSNNKKMLKLKSTKMNITYIPVSQIAGECVKECEENNEDFEECPRNDICEEVKEVKPVFLSAPQDELYIYFNEDNLKKAFIYSEIINKPMCKRRGRWR